MAEFTWVLDEATAAGSSATTALEFPRTYRRIFKRLLPYWLTEGEGELVLYSLGLLKDATAEYARQALLARFPSYAPLDALDVIGRDRRIVRGISETIGDFRARLRGWRQALRFRGNAFSMLRQIRAYCGPTVRVRSVDRRGNWYTIDRDGTESVSLKTSNWNWDALGPERFSRFWIIIYPDAGSPWALAPSAIAAWAAETDTHLTYSMSMTTEHAATIRDIIRVWQPDGTRCEWVIVAFGDASFDPTAPEPDGTWGLFGKDSAGNRVPARLATARYFAGVDGGLRGNP